MQALGLQLTLGQIEIKEHGKPVCWGGDKFVALSTNGYSAYSSDGITWTDFVMPEYNTWTSVTYGAGQFVAVSGTGNNRVATSKDGINWSAVPAAAQKAWFKVTYSDNQFVAVSTDGFIMYSGDAPGSTYYYDQTSFTSYSNTQIISRHGVEATSDAAATLGYAELTEQGCLFIEGYEKELDGRYRPLFS